jgi:hypothetical protein
MPYLVTIRTFKHSTDAYHYKQVLKKNSIESYLETPDFEADSILDVNELSEANLSVLQGDVEDAIEIIKSEDLNYFGAAQENMEAFHGNELILLKKMSYQKEAYLYKARLENEGITCFIVDKHATNPLPLVGLTAETIELYIPQSKLETAKRIILELDNNQIDETETNFDYKPVIIIAVIILIALFLLVQQYFNMY